MAVGRRLDLHALVGRTNADDVALRVVDVEFGHTVPAPFACLGDVAEGKTIPQSIGVQAAEIGGSRWLWSVVETEGGEFVGQARNGLEHELAVAPIEHREGRSGDAVIVNGNSVMLRSNRTERAMPQIIAFRTIMGPPHASP